MNQTWSTGPTPTTSALSFALAESLSQSSGDDVADPGQQIVVGDGDRLHPELVPKLDVLLRSGASVGVERVTVEIRLDEHRHSLAIGSS